MSATPQIPPAGVTSMELTVRYAETDQMGIAYHANYPVWCDMARTALLRGHGLSYRDLEAGGLLLAVVEAHVRYRSPARFDDRLVVCACRMAESALPPHTNSIRVMPL